MVKRGHLGTADRTLWRGRRHVRLPVEERACLRIVSEDTDDLY
jgi:hypothetical protein